MFIGSSWPRSTAGRRPSPSTTAVIIPRGAKLGKHRFPAWNAGRQPERPEDVVFQEMSLVSTRSRGRKPRYFEPGVSDPRVLGPGVLVSGFVILNEMTEARRQSSIGEEQRSGFRRHWRSVCRDVQAGRKIDGRKMSKPCRCQFRRPEPFSCLQIFLSNHNRPMTQRHLNGAAASMSAMSSNGGRWR